MKATDQIALKTTDKGLRKGELTVILSSKGKGRSILTEQKVLKELSREPISYSMQSNRPIPE